MRLLNQNEKTFEIEFTGQNGRLQSYKGNIPSGQSDPAGYIESCKKRISDLETVAGITNLTHEVVTQIIAGRAFTMASAVDLWTTNSAKRMVHSPTTIATNRVLVDGWLRHGTLTDRSVASITPEDIASYINRGSQKRSSALRTLSAIRALFGFLIHEGYCLRNPAARGCVKVNYASFTHSEKEAPVKETFSDEEIRLLMRGADPFWKAAVIIALGTGLRLSDIAQLEWSSVGSERMAIWTDKTNTRVSLPLTTEINAALNELSETGIQYVFPEQRDIILDPSKRAQLSTQFSRLCKKAGIANGKSFHCLRHTYATRRANEGLTVTDIATELGHRGTDITQQYIHTGRGPVATPCSA